MAMLSKSKDPAMVSTTVNTKVDKPKIKANVPIMESRSCHKFMILSYASVVNGNLYSLCETPNKTDIHS